PPPLRAYPLRIATCALFLPSGYWAKAVRIRRSPEASLIDSSKECDEPGACLATGIHRWFREAPTTPTTAGDAAQSLAPCSTNTLFLHRLPRRRIQFG